MGGDGLPLTARLPLGLLSRLRAVPPSAPLVGILLLAALLRAVRLGDDSLWLDEAVSIEIAGQDPVSIARDAIRGDTHPPLYYLLLGGWMALFGDSEVAVRSLSAVLGVLAVAAVYRVGAVLVDRHTGLLAALVASVSAFFIRYSQEARMYSLLSLTAAVSFLALVRLLDARSPRTIAVYVVSTTLLLFSHLHGLFLLAAQVAVVAVELRRLPPGRRLPAARAWLAILAAPALLVGSWLGAIAYVGLDRKTSLISWLGAPSFRDLARTPFEYLGFWDAESLPLVAAVAALVALAALWAGSSPGVRARLRHPRELVCDAWQRRGFRVLALWLALPVLLAFTISHAYVPLYLSKYTIGSAAALFVAIAWACTRLPRRPAAAAATALAAVLALGAIRYHDTFVIQDWRGAVRAVEAEARPGEPVLLARFFDDAPYGYYARRKDLRVLALERADRLDGERAWLVAGGSADWAAALASLRQQGFEASEHRGFAGVAVSLLERSR